jgi:hypothetical protein
VRSAALLFRCGGAEGRCGRFLPVGFPVSRGASVTLIERALASRGWGLVVVSMPRGAGVDQALDAYCPACFAAVPSVTPRGTAALPAETP